MSIPRTIAHALEAVAVRAPSAPCLLAPQQGVSMTYGEVNRATSVVASALEQWGLRAGSREVVAMDLPNTAENLMLQLALARTGSAVATAKDAAALDSLATKLTSQNSAVRGCVAASKGSWLASVELSLPALLADNLFAEIGGRGSAGAQPTALPDSLGAHAGEELPHAYFNSATPLTHTQALALGQAAASQLALTPDDRVAVAITLSHAFGIGSACGAALASGAAIVLPAVGGLRGCGVPEQRAAVTLEVIAGTRCTALFADTHTLKAFAEPQMVAKREALDVSSLRTGVVKVGSGADFLDETVEFAGVSLFTLGKRA